MAILTDAGVALTDSGEVLTTRTGLEAGLFARFRFEEASGLVCRNEVRTTIIDDDFSNVTAGIPAGASADSQFLDGDETTSRSETGGVLELSLASGADANIDLFGIRWNGLIESGKNYVGRLRIRHTAKTGPSTLQLYFGTAALTPATSTEWQDIVFKITSNGTDVRLLARTDSSNQTTVLEIDRFTITEENAATPSEDMSGLTAPGVSGRGANLDGTDYISAPWDGGFTYPTSLACAFKLDTLTSVTIRTLLSLTDASASDVYWQLGLTASGTNVYVARRNTTVDAQSPVAALTTNWHTVVIVFHDATSYTVYLDGDLLTERTGLTSVPASANVDTLLIGLLRLTSPTQYADGITFDEVSAWNRELSAYDVMNWTRGVLSQKPSVFNTGLAIGL